MSNSVVEYDNHLLSFATDCLRVQLSSVHNQMWSVHSVPVCLRWFWWSTSQASTNTGQHSEPEDANAMGQTDIRQLINTLSEGMEGKWVGTDNNYMVDEAKLQLKHQGVIHTHLNWQHNLQDLASTY